MELQVSRQALSLIGLQVILPLYRADGSFAFASDPSKRHIFVAGCHCISVSRSETVTRTHGCAVAESFS